MHHMLKKRIKKVYCLFKCLVFYNYVINHLHKAALCIRSALTNNIFFKRKKTFDQVKNFVTYITKIFFMIHKSLISLIH